MLICFIKASFFSGFAKQFWEIARFGWFSLLPGTKAANKRGMQQIERSIPILHCAAIWTNALRAELATSVLAPYLKHCRWFGGKGGEIRSVRILSEITLRDSPSVARVFLVEVVSEDGLSGTYCLPMDFAAGEFAGRLLAEMPGAVIARCAGPNGSSGSVIYDAVWGEGFRRELLETILRDDPPLGSGDVLFGVQGDGLNPVEAARVQGQSRVVTAEHSNSAIVYGASYFLKLYRKIERGGQRDAEILRFLTEEQPFNNVPRYCGQLNCDDGSGAAVIGLLVSFAPNHGDAWTQSLGALSQWFTQLSREGVGDGQTPRVGVDAPYLQRLRQLGGLTAQLHQALSGASWHREFSPEAFTREDQETLAEGMGRTIEETMARLNKWHAELPGQVGGRAQLPDAAELLDCQRALLEEEIVAEKIAIHGDYHLGQVLDTGADFVIMDFEGEPRRSFQERARKRSPLVDVAGMLRSFDYAASVALMELPEGAAIKPWAEAWVRQVSAAFVEAYRVAAAGASFLPKSDAAFDRLLDWSILDKALYEICYELDYRPALVGIPLRAVNELLRKRRDKVSLVG